MTDQVPEFSDGEIAKIVKELYGIEGEISSLVSFEDQNARIKTTKEKGGETFVLKMGNTRWPMDWLNLQTEALERLAERAPELNLPRVVPTKDNQTITMVDGFPVRLLTFIPGDILGPATDKGKRSPRLCKNLGRFMGRFTAAMQGYTHIGADRPDDLWNLDNILSCKAYLPDVVLKEDRDRISRFYQNYEENILPLVPKLRRSIIHADANEQNILVATGDPENIVGLIDFGDMSMASTINELAITVAYALLGVGDIEAVAAQIIAGYEEEFSLTDTERKVLMGLAAMRLVQSITMSSHSAKQFPDNDYIIVSQKPARELLKKLEQLSMI